VPGGAGDAGVSGRPQENEEDFGNKCGRKGAGKRRVKVCGSYRKERRFDLGDNPRQAYSMLFGAYAVASIFLRIWALRVLAVVICLALSMYYAVLSGWVVLQIVTTVAGAVIIYVEISRKNGKKDRQIEKRE
jgi:hypothetical protein